jgi:hypothetical protein
MTNEKIDLKYIVQGVTTCPQCEKITIFCVAFISDAEKEPTHIPVRLSEEEEIAAKVGATIQKVVRNLPGVQMFTDQQNCSSNKIAFNVTPDNYSAMGKPTIGDVLGMSLKVEERGA